MWIVGLERRIILSVALGLAAILFLFGYLAVAAVQQSKDLILQQRLSLAETTAGYIDFVLGRTLRQMEETVARSPVSGADRTATDERRLLSDLYHNLGSFSTVLFVDSSGTIVQTEPPESSGLVTTISSFTHIQKLLQSGRPSINLIMPEVESDQPLVSLGVPVTNRGNVTGIVAGQISMARAGLDVLPDPRLGTTGRSELIDDRGMVVASSVGDNSRVVDHVAVLSDLLKGRQAGIRLHRMPPGSTRADHIVAYAPLGTLPWGIVVEQDRDVALALPEELQIKMLVLGLLALAVAGSVAWIDVRRLVEPLRTLTLAAQRMAAGGLDTPVEVKRGDEVGTLARSFESMRIKLKLSLEEIRRWNEELEKRVQERTREVERRNQELLVINSLAETVNRSQDLSLDLNDVLATALDQVLAITEADVGSISLRDEHSGIISRRILRSSAADAWRGRCPDLEECLCGQVALTGRPFLTGRALPRKDGLQATCWERGCQSLAVVPLRSEDRVQGVLFVASSRPDHFSASEQKLLAAVSHQISIAVEKARLYGEIQRREDTRRQLLAKVISAQEEERKRIARELHDESTQALTGLIMSIQATQDALPDSFEREKERLARAKAQAIHALTEMRQMILDLRPTALDDLGLVPAIRWYAETHLHPLGVHASVETAGSRRRLPPEIETSLFRITQEALNNVAKHSRAHEVGIRLDIVGDEVGCRVEDDGVGFDVDAYMVRPDSYQGLGLLGMRERISLLGGCLSIESRPGMGTSLQITIPLKGE